MPRAIEALPRLRGYDQTGALLREGYDFISRRCDALGSDAFAARLMLRPVICMRGEEATKAFYDGNRFTRRNGAMPPTVLRLLQDKGSVQQLDGAAHRHRKALFADLLMSQTRVNEFQNLFRATLFDALPEWIAQGDVPVFKAFNHLLTITARRWIGIPEGLFDDRTLCDELISMIENTGRFDPRVLAALWRRRHTERQIRALVLAIRNGELRCPEDSPLSHVTAHQDLEGERLSHEAAGVELLNILRPTVAIGRYIMFCAMALEAHPRWKEALHGDDKAQYETFVEEVRRFYPFFPFVGGKVREAFTWKEYSFALDDWVLLDLFGTNRDPALFPEPDRFDPERSLSWRAQDHRFIPQGGGRTRHTHRCPGEAITVAAMAEATRFLVEEVRYRVEDCDLRLPRTVIPARPERSLVLSHVRWQS